MADKRITTVDEMTNADERADFVLIVRGTQKDLRRLRLSRLPVDFDLHDDVATELATLAGIDRMLISDEGTPGAPQRWVKLATLQSFFTNAFDLHDDVDTELTAAAKADRLLISDEGESGDPQKWISVENLANSLGVLKVEKIATEFTLGSHNEVVSHSLGRVPLGFQLRMICKTAEGGYSAGDEILLGFYSLSYPTGSTIFWEYFFLNDVNASSFRVKADLDVGMRLQQKTSTSEFQVTNNKWKWGITIWG